MRGRIWTEAENDRLREVYPKTRYVADLVPLFAGRRVNAIRHQARKLGLACDLHPSAEELARILDLRRRGASYGEIVAQTGRSSQTLYKLFREAGLTSNQHHWTPEEVAELLRLHAEGYSDREIAEEFGLDRKTICDRRNALGLPSNAGHRRYRDRVAETTRKQLERAGLPSIGHLRPQAHRAFARSYNLPEALPVRAVLVLLDLVRHGPSNWRQVAERLGIRIKKKLSDTFVVNRLADGSRNHGTAFSCLADHGLVTHVRQQIAGYKYVWVYLPTPLALDLLEQAAARQQSEEATHAG